MSKLVALLPSGEYRKLVFNDGDDLSDIRSRITTSLALQPDSFSLHSFADPQPVLDDFYDGKLSDFTKGRPLVIKFKSSSHPPAFRPDLPSYDCSTRIPSFAHLPTPAHQALVDFFTNNTTTSSQDAVLLFSPPGMGKTTTVNKAACDAGAFFVRVSPFLIRHDLLRHCSDALSA